SRSRAIARTSSTCASRSCRRRTSTRSCTTTRRSCWGCRTEDTRVRETAERLGDGMWLKRAWYDASRVRSETVVQDRDGAPSAAVWGPHRGFDLDRLLVREVLIASGRLGSSEQY